MPLPRTVPPARPRPRPARAPAGPGRRPRTRRARRRAPSRRRRPLWRRPKDKKSECVRVPAPQEGRQTQAATANTDLGERRGSRARLLHQVGQRRPQRAPHGRKAGIDLREGGGVGGRAGRRERAGGPPTSPSHRARVRVEPGRRVRRKRRASAHGGEHVDDVVESEDGGQDLVEGGAAGSGRGTGSGSGTPAQTSTHPALERPRFGVQAGLQLFEHASNQVRNGGRLRLSSGCGERGFGGEVARRRAGGLLQQLLDARVCDYLAELRQCLCDDGVHLKGCGGGCGKGSDFVSVA